MTTASHSSAGRWPAVFATFAQALRSREDGYTTPEAPGSLFALACVRRAGARQLWDVVPHARAQLAALTGLPLSLIEALVADGATGRGGAALAGAAVSRATVPLRWRSVERAVIGVHDARGTVLDTLPVLRSLEAAGIASGLAPTRWSDQAVIVLGRHRVVFAGPPGDAPYRPGLVLTNDETTAGGLTLAGAMVRRDGQGTAVMPPLVAPSTACDADTLMDAWRYLVPRLVETATAAVAIWPAVRESRVSPPLRDTLADALSVVVGGQGASVAVRTGPPGETMAGVMGRLLRDGGLSAAAQDVLLSRLLAPALVTGHP